LDIEYKNLALLLAHNMTQKQTNFNVSGELISSLKKRWPEPHRKEEKQSIDEARSKESEGFIDREILLKNKMRLIFLTFQGRRKL
jgi:hypothetical protein